MKHRIIGLIGLIVISATTIFSQPVLAAKPVQVRIETSLGNIELELDAKRAPTSVKNFLGYVDRGDYNGTVFHRVIPGFMIQGGGFDKQFSPRAEKGSIRNEADNGLKNLTGTIAMARTNDPHSATNQFFINTVDNAFLDHKGKTMQGWGYAVFGKVTKGMDVARKIENVSTRTVGPFQNVPVTPVIINRVVRVK